MGARDPLVKCNITIKPGLKFSLGEVLTTETVSKLVDQVDVEDACNRHALGDWGVLKSTDRAKMNQALRAGREVMSLFISSTGVKFWIRTNYCRTTTLVQMGDDYWRILG